MCGIVGFAIGNSNTRFSKKRMDVFTQLLVSDVLRGWESTGVFSVPFNNDIGTPAYTFKRALTAADFIQTMGYKNFIAGHDKYRIVVGHNRAATRGSISDINAHPFQIGPITMVHNGTLTNGYHTLPHIPGVFVDSASIAATLAEYEDPRDALKIIDGDYALVWHDARDDSMNIARNEGRPLYWNYEAGEDSMYFASEVQMLYWILDRNNIKLDPKHGHTFLYPAVNTVYKFGKSKLREFEKLPYTVKPNSVVRPFSRPPMRTTNTYLDGSNTRIISPTDRSSKEDHSSPLSKNDERLLSLGGVRECPNSVNPLSHAQSLKRKTKAERRLEKLNLRYGQPIIIRDLKVFVPYSPTNKEYGAIMGFTQTSSGRFGVQLWNVSNTIWTEGLNAGGKLYGTLTGVRYLNNNRVLGSIVLAAVFNSDYHRRYVLKEGADKKDDNLRHIISRAVTKTIENDSSSDEISGELVMVRGPQGIRIPLSEFQRLIQHGCGNCDERILVEDHEDVLWCNDVPVCPTCASDPQLQRDLGLRT